MTAARSSDVRVDWLTYGRRVLGARVTACADHGVVDEAHTW